jgi:hypothetical protein
MCDFETYGDCHDVHLRCAKCPMRAALHSTSAAGERLTTMPRGGVEPDWHAESVKLYRQNTALRTALQEQHDWHLAQGDKDFGDGITLNIADEYGDSGMCERTTSILSEVLPSGIQGYEAWKSKRGDAAGETTSSDVDATPSNEVPEANTVDLAGASKQPGSGASSPPAGHTTPDAARMREALEFYAKAWGFKTNKKRPGLEWFPKEELLDDCGNRALAALDKLPPEVKAEGGRGEPVCQFCKRQLATTSIVGTHGLCCECVPGGFPLSTHPASPDVEAIGFAVVSFGKIDVTTVSPTRRGALVNWLVTSARVPIFQWTSDDEIETSWRQICGRDHQCAEVAIAALVEKGRGA